MGSIYKVTNTVNGKAYIGQTRRDAEKTRIRDHLTGNSNSSQLVKRAVKKYGRDAFTYEILHDGIIPEFLDPLEKEAIEEFNTVSPHGYNLDTGGGGGKTPSEETRRKQSEAHKGKKNHQYGKPLSPEHRRSISEATKGEKSYQYGKPLSPETRHKISEAKQTPEYVAARKFFFSVPSDMDLKEKRKYLRQKFPEKHNGTIYNWCKKFESERLTALRL